MSTHRIKFSAETVKAAMVEGLKVYNLTDGLEAVYRLIQPEDIIPASAVTQKLKDGREVVRIIDMEGREEALAKMIEDDINREGVLYHFVAGWAAREGLVEPMPEAASQTEGEDSVVSLRKDQANAPQ